MLYSNGRLLQIPFFSLSWVGTTLSNNDALNGLLNLLSQQFLHSNDIEDVLYSQIHSDYHALIVHALSCHPETQERWGKYWVELASRSRSEESRKEVRFLLHTLVRSAPNDFPIQPGHIVHLCWFDEKEC